DGRRQDARPTRVAATQQPQLFLLTDVRQVPDQRTHQRVVLTTEFVIVELHESQGPRPRPRQVVGQPFLGSHNSPRVGREASARLETEAAMPLAITRSEKSSPGQRPWSTLRTSRSIAPVSSGGALAAASATHRLAASYSRRSRSPTRAAVSQA